MPGAPAAGSPPRSGKSRLSESRDGRDSQTREYSPSQLYSVCATVHLFPVGSLNGGHVGIHV